MKLQNNTYDILKKIALYVLPALATLILALGQIRKIDYSEQIAATITALDTFLGGILGLSSKNYWKDANNMDAHDPKEEGLS